MSARHRAGGIETLSVSLARGGGRHDRSSRALAIAAFALATLVLLLTIGVNLGLAERTDRAQWLRPQAADRAVATQVSATRPLGDRTVTVVHLAPRSTERAELPAPPGLIRFPRPGEIFVSPALEKALADPTTGAAGADLRGATGTVDRAGLSGPDQLLAIVGHREGEAAVSGPAWSNEIRPDDFAGPTPIASFAGRPLDQASEANQYTWLTRIASLLLIVPVLSLAGSAARLTSGRRQHRLAVLRLAGASRGTLTQLTCRDAASTAAAGVATGAAVYGLLLPLVRQVPMMGTRWYAGDLWVGVLALLGVLAVMVAVAIVSASVPLRQILRDPIAVAERQTPRSPGWWRLVVALIVGAVFAWLAKRDGTGPAAILVALGVLFAVMNVLGPLVVSGLGRVMAARARTGQRLIAARRILDDPKAIWRNVAAVTLTAFIAGFLALFSVGTATPFRGEAGVLDVAVTAPVAKQTARAVRTELDRAGMPATVSVSETGGALMAVSNSGGETAWLAVTLPEDAAQQAEVRGAVAKVVGPVPQASGMDALRQENAYGEDFARATIVILAVALTMTAITAGIMAAASVLDRRETYRRLWQAGTPVSVLDRSRVIEATAPVLVCAGIAATTGLLAAMPMTLSTTGPSLSGLLVLLATVATGVLAIRIALRASRGLLTRAAQT